MKNTKKILFQTSEELMRAYEQAEEIERLKKLYEESLVK